MSWIKFTAVNDYGETVGHTEWTEEHTSRDAPALLTKFRAQVGDGYKYTIERKGDSRTPNIPKMFRFRIAEKDNVYYSRIIQEAEKDECLAQIKEQFPKADVTEEAR